MNRYGRWIKERLARDPAKTQAGLADHLGLDRSAVSRMLSGARQIKAEEFYRACEYLGVPPPDGVREEAAVFLHAPAEGRGLRTAPIFGVERDASGVWKLLRHLPPVDARPRAPHFESAARVFGFYAPDDSAAPRFKAGEIVWIDPARPVRPGDDAAIVERSEGPERVLLGEFRRATAAEIIFNQYKSRKERRVSAANWAALHVLARS